MRNVSFYLDKALETIKAVQQQIDEGHAIKDPAQLLTLIDQVREVKYTYIRFLHQSGVPNKDVAKMFNLTPARISQICHLDSP